MVETAANAENRARIQRRRAAEQLRERRRAVSARNHVRRSAALGSRARVPASPPVDARFAGQCVVCVASGPSLTTDDCVRVGQSGLPVIVVNRTIEALPQATIWYAGDDRFWDQYHEIVTDAERWTCAPRAARRYQLRLHRVTGPYNSGLRAVQLAVQFGAKRIILLGYDCQHTGGKAHWHENYQRLGNAKSVRNWPGQFAAFARRVRGSVQIDNATRQTALKCFPRVELEQVMECC